MSAITRKDAKAPGEDFNCFELLENMREFFFVTSLDLNTVHFASRAYERIWGRSCESLLREPRSWMEAIVPEDLERVRGLLAASPFQELGYRIFRPDGAVSWISARAFPVRDGAGAVARVVGIAEDITERIRAQEDLRLEGEKYRILMEGAPEAILVIDCDSGLYVDFNQSAVDLFGLTAEELRRTGPGRLSPALQPDGRRSVETAREYVQEALAGGKPVFEWTCRTAGSRDFPCEVRLAALPSRNRRLVRATITDISERKALERQFQQAQKMEAVGRLAGGVAHDFNNLLTVIMGFGQILERRIPKDDPARADLEEIVRATDRAAALSRQLLVFSRQHAVQPVPLQLNDTVRQMEKLFRRVIGEDITLGSSLDADLGNVCIDPGQMEQVLMNLVVNARDAMPKGGKLTLETKNVELNDDPVWGLTGIVPGPFVMMSVSDTGIGMTKEVREHIFEPFYTTKEPGKGTGLGLSTVYEIVRRGGGHVAVRSEPGRGTSFHIYLPRTDQRAGAAPRDAGQEEAGGRETVMVVEDEKDVRCMAERILRGKGYTAVTAASPEEALAWAEKSGSPMPMLITDVVMPGMSGPALAAKLKARWPEMKVLYISGYTEGQLHDQDLLEAGTGLLHKPFAPSVLTRRVREMLDAVAGA